MPGEVKITTDRKNALYRTCETITFFVEAAGCSRSGLTYDLELDRYRQLDSGAVPADGELIVAATCPGFINIRVCGGAGPAEAVVAVEPDNIRPSRPRPDDFDEFWGQKLKALAGIAPNIKMEAMPALTESDLDAWKAKWPYYGNRPEATSEIEVHKVEANTLEGNPVRGYMARPANAAPGSLPALLLTHGAGIGDSDLPKVCAAARLGFLAMDINAHGLLQGQPALYYRGVADAAVLFDGFFRKGRHARETLYLVTMYLRHRRALDVLCDQPQWDGRNLQVRGESQGGCLALACAGLDSRVSAVCASVPAFMDCADNYSLENWFRIGRENPEDAEKVRNALRYISVCNFAPQTKAPAYFTVGYLDRDCIPASVYAGYNLYAGPKRIYDGPLAGHGGIPFSIQYQGFTDFMFETMR